MRVRVETLRTSDSLLWGKVYSDICDEGDCETRSYPTAGHKGNADITFKRVSSTAFEGRIL